MCYNFTMQKKRSLVSPRSGLKFGLGFLAGAAAGAIAGLFLAPKSGKIMRRDAIKKYKQLKKLLHEKEVDKKVSEIFGNATAESKKLFELSRDRVIVELANLKESLREIDKEKYDGAVEKAMIEVKDQFKDSKDRLDRLKKYLSDEWKKLSF